MVSERSKSTLTFDYAEEGEPAKAAQMGTSYQLLWRNTWRFEHGHYERRKVRPSDGYWKETEPGSGHRRFDNPESICGACVNY